MKIYNLYSGTEIAGNFGATDLGDALSYSYQVNGSGALGGTLTVQESDDKTNWFTLTAPTPITSGNNKYIAVTNCCARYTRLVNTGTPSVNTMTVILAVKYPYTLSP